MYPSIDLVDWSFPARVCQLIRQAALSRMNNLDVKVKWQVFGMIPAENYSLVLLIKLVAYLNGKFMMATALDV